MTYLELAKQIVTEQPPRCSECARLEAREVTVLRCAACGYKAVAGAHPAPQPGDLAYPLAYVREQAPGLYQPHRGRFLHWVRQYQAEGWTRDDAERAAFRRVMLSPPARRQPTREEPSHG
jgi:hypothetical protein